MKNQKAQAVSVNHVWYVVYPKPRKAERCHNRGTARLLADKFNTKLLKGKPHGILA